MFADAEDRHDVGVVQLRRRLRLALEATPRPGVLPELLGQDLEGDVPAERDLLRLVDDAHAAVADLADDAVVAQALERRQRPSDGGCLHLPAVFLDLLHLGQGREVLADVVGQLGMPVDVLLQRRAFAAPVALGELIRQAVEQDVAFGAVSGHVRYPPARRACRRGLV